MSKVLIVIGTGHFDLHDLCEKLTEKKVDCTICHWHSICSPPGSYDLVILFGLTEYRSNADKYAGRVRASIGNDTPFLVVSTWMPKIMAQYMKEKYNAEYEWRHGSFPAMLEKVLRMLKEAKTAPV